MIDVDAIEKRAEHLIGLTICEGNATRIAFDMAGALAEVPALVAEIRRMRTALLDLSDEAERCNRFNRQIAPSYVIKRFPAAIGLEDGNGPDR